MGDKPTQETPQGETIPVPKRKDVFAAFRKVATADKPKSGRVGGTKKKK